MDTKKIKELIKILEESKLSKLAFKDKHFELQIEKDEHRGVVVQSSRPAQFQGVDEQFLHPTKPAHLEPTRKGVETPSNYEVIKSPMVGTFYTAPAPKEPAFIQVGDEVEKDTIVCIIEAMKVLNEVKAGVKGVVKEIHMQDQSAVEFGTPLFSVEPR